MRRKVLEHLSPAKLFESEIISKFRKYVLDYREVLHKMIQSSVPMPFAMTKDSSLFFALEHSNAV